MVSVNAFEKVKTREHINLVRKRWRHANREKDRATTRAYYAKNADKLRLKARQEWERNGHKRTAHKNAYAARYRQEHPDRVAASKKRTTLRYRERYLGMMRDHYRRNKVKHIAGCKAWEARNKEKVKGYKKAWIERNPDKVRAAIPAQYARTALWRKLNPLKVLEHCNRRRAMKEAATVEDCSAKMKLIRLMPLCNYCLGLISGTPCADHITPLKRGGLHAPNNLVACCKPCNSSKGIKLLSEWSGRKLEMAA